MIGWKSSQNVKYRPSFFPSFFDRFISYCLQKIWSSESPRFFIFMRCFFRNFTNFLCHQKKTCFKIGSDFYVCLKIEEEDFDPFRRWVSARFNNFWVVTKSGFRKNYHLVAWWKITSRNVTPNFANSKKFKKSQKSFILLNFRLSVWS